jgi:hypothetical protein
LAGGFRYRANRLLASGELSRIHDESDKVSLWFGKLGKRRI